MGRELLVVGWHNVTGTWCFPGRDGRGRLGLARQLRLLRRVANVVDLAPALDSLRAGRPLPPRAVALTFDDGYRDNLTDAAPLLEELGLPATFFLVPDVLSGATTPWWEVLGAAFARTDRRAVCWEDHVLGLEGPDRRTSYVAVSDALKRVDERTRRTRVEALVDELRPGSERDAKPLFLEWDGARALVAKGMSVGSHSLDHTILANEAPAVQQQNLCHSRRVLEARLDVEIRLLAYPNGDSTDFDGVTEHAAHGAGYDGAVTTIPGRNSSSTPPFRLRRFVVGPEHGVVGLRSIVTHDLRRADARAATP
jgi:peptidoglycan/xylan/chitin deacetylase (PgdA/CDA1 family)